MKLSCIRFSLLRQLLIVHGLQLYYIIIYCLNKFNKIYIKYYGKLLFRRAHLNCTSNIVVKHLLSNWKVSCSTGWMDITQWARVRVDHDHFSACRMSYVACGCSSIVLQVSLLYSKILFSWRTGKGRCTHSIPWAMTMQWSDGLLALDYCTPRIIYPCDNRGAFHFFIYLKCPAPPGRPRPVDKL